MELTTGCLMNMLEPEAVTVSRGLRQRDPSLMDHLIQRYQYRLFRYLLILTGNREDAEDLFQETWIRVLEKGHQYDHRWKFETWLFTIARHLAIDSMRRRRPQSLDAPADPEGVNENIEPKSTASPLAFETAFQGEEAAILASALRHLPSSYREVLTLRFHEDLPLAEIAQVTGSPVSTVKSRLYRGLALLRRWLKDLSV